MMEKWQRLVISHALSVLALTLLFCVVLSTLSPLACPPMQLNSMELIKNTLHYAKEIERIV